MIDHRLKKYFTLVKHYHSQSPLDRVKLLGGVIRATVMTEKDPFTRNLLLKFQLKESQKYVPANQSSEPPEFA